MEFCKKIKKHPIVSSDSVGFINNRIMSVYIIQGTHVLNERIASVEDIDTTLKLGCNLPMGPLELADLIGTEVV